MIETNHDKGKNEAQRALAIARQALDKADASVRELTELSNGVHGIIMKVEVAGSMGNVMASISSYKDQLKRGSFFGQTEPSVDKICEKALAHGKEMFDKAKTIHIGNIDAIANNIALRGQIEKTMRAIGIPSRYSTYDYKRSSSRSKTESKHISGWYEDIRRCIPIDDCFNAESLTQFESKVEAYRKGEGAKERKVQQEEEKAKNAKIAKRKADKEMAVLIVKYKLSDDAEWGDVLDKLLDSDKYLRLAHFLRLNRGDWNDGFSYARHGLDGFSVDKKNPKDKEIVKCLEAVYALNCEEPDGRVFRDCEWSYDAIFALVNSELMDDYTKAEEKMERYG